MSTKDTATYISKTFAVGNKWQRKDYWIKGMKLQSEETFLDDSLKVHTDVAKWYTETGVVKELQKYEKDKLAEVYYYYDNGNKKAVLLYNADQKVISQKGWEENGDEIANYIYEQEAKFPGGAEGWRDYLVSKINVNTAVKAKAPLGVYTVKVQFIVD